jgi:hypothetical protein
MHIAAMVHIDHGLAAYEIMDGLAATKYALSHDGDVVGIEGLNLTVNHGSGINEKRVIAVQAYEAGFVFSGTIISEVASRLTGLCRKRTVRDDEKIVVAVIVKLYRNPLFGRFNGKLNGAGIYPLMRNIELRRADFHLSEGCALPVYAHMNGLLKGVLEQGKPRQSAFRA